MIHDHPMISSEIPRTFPSTLTGMYLFPILMVCMTVCMFTAENRNMEVPAQDNQYQKRVLHGALISKKRFKQRKAMLGASVNSPVAPAQCKSSRH